MLSDGSKIIGDVRIKEINSERIKLEGTIAGKIKLFVKKFLISIKRQKSSRLFTSAFFFLVKRQKILFEKLKREGQLKREIERERGREERRE